MMGKNFWSTSPDISRTFQEPHLIFKDHLSGMYSCNIIDCTKMHMLFPVHSNTRQDIKA